MRIEREGAAAFAALDVGIAFDLRPEAPPRDGPDDLLEEYDSKATVDAVARALRVLGHRPRLLGGGRAFLEALLRAPPDLVFNMAEGWGTRSREAHVPAACEMLGVPYTHSDPLTLATTLHKATAKRIVAAAGLPTPAFEVWKEVLESTALRFPVIAKPVAEGSGMGVRSGARIDDPAALREEVQRLLDGYRQPVLVEEFCPGAELTVGVAGTGREARLLGVMEVRPKAGSLSDFVYSVDVKRRGFDAVEYLVPPCLEDETVASAASVAVGAHRVLECRDISRVDLRLDAAGRPLFLEINPLPGMTPGWGDVVLVAERSGTTYEELIGLIVESARARAGV
ncbi:MAG TPA: D-alanine--D-alanine ligase [Actinomycetota bacterium]